VTSAAEVCGARVSGAAVGAREVTFEPGPLRSGAFRFDVGTAGATSLVLQTLFFPLALAQAESAVTITGGTHVPWSPCYHYLEAQWLPVLRRIGFDADLRMAKAGFYPQGGGEINAKVRPQDTLKPFRIDSRGPLTSISGLSAIANLPLHIAERQRSRALERLRAKGLRAEIETVEMPSPGKGTMLLLLCRFENATSCHFSLGAIGKRAEKVADEACLEFFEFLSGEAAIEHHLADQLLIPLALAPGESFFSTNKVTQHLITNAAVVGKFLKVKIAIGGEIGSPGKVTVEREP
jgi:RNA 3'-terminal phosphate cyclase (ATP)